MTHLQILKILHPFIKEGNWFTSDSLRKDRYFNEERIGFQVYNKLSATLVLLYTNGYLERKERKRIYFSKTRKVSFKGKYAYKLNMKYQSLPENQLKLKL